MSSDFTQLTKIEESNSSLALPPLFTQLYSDLLSSNINNFKKRLDTFIKQLIDPNSPEHSLRFDLFIENHVLKWLLQTLRNKSYNPQYFSAIFHNIQVLIQNISSESQRLYLVSYLHKQGYFSQKYNFTNEQVSYYILILRSLVRKMLLQQRGYFNIFVNIKQPTFPILYSAMKFYNHPQSHVVTASRYILLELASANIPYLKQTYFLNFPFVSYYAYLCCQIRSLLFDSMKKEYYEKIMLILMFLQQFVSLNDRESINMYANSFFAIVVRHITKMIQKQDLSKMFKIIEVIVNKIKVQKILWGIRKLFFGEIEDQFLRFLESNEIQINSYSQTFKPISYLDSYLNYVQKHCACLYSKNYQKKNQSTISSVWKSSASYLVYNEKGLESQLDRISQAIGVQIELNAPINHDTPSKFSYVGIFEQEQTMKKNPLFKTISIGAAKNQLTYFYFIKVLIQLKILYQHLIQNLSWHLSILSNCQSISSPKFVYIYLLKYYKDLFHLDNNLQIQINIYKQQTKQKLIYFVMEQGWKTFKTHGGYLSIPSEQYSPTIFRDIQNDCLFLMIMNLLLKNEPVETKNQLYKQQTGKKTKIMQKILSSFDSELSKKIYLQFNCQYLQILNEIDQVQQNIQISQYKIWQDPSSKVILQFTSDKQKPFTLYFTNEKLGNYVYENLISIRRKAREFEHELENLCFKVQ